MYLEGACIQSTVKFLIVAASLIEAAPQTFKKFKFFDSSFLIGKPSIEAAGRLFRFVKDFFFKIYLK